MPEVWNTSRPGGVRWRTAYKYRDSYAAGASQTQVWVEAAWEDTPLLRADFLGYATWDGVSPWLSRVVPLAGPYSGGGLDGEGEAQVQLNPQRCLRMDLDLFYPEAPDADHVYPGVSPGGDPESGDQFLAVDGRVHYQCTFGPVPYYVLTDAQAGAEGSAPEGAPDPARIPPESKRFVRVTRRYMPEARKTPSAGFVCYDPLGTFDAFVIQEVGFVPTFQVEIVAELIEWPVEAFPDAGIAACLGAVNASAVFLMGKSYGPGTLLYKGPAREVEPTDSAAGRKVINVPHLLGWRPTGWNTHRLNDGRWKPLVVKGTQPATGANPGDGTLKPMFPPADFAKLFEPG